MAWLGSAGVTRGLSMGGTERVMGGGGTVTPTQEKDVERAREKGDEGAVSRKREEACAGGGGTGPLVALPSTLSKLGGGENRAVLSVSHPD